VSVSHVSNVLGMIYPVEEIAAMARRVRARFLLDGAQSAPHVPIDVRRFGCDWFAFSGHKLGGPFGLGVLWAKPELLEEMTVRQEGGGGTVAKGTLRRHKFKARPDSFEAGTGDPASAVGLDTALEQIERFGGSAAMWRWLQSLSAYGLETLGAVPGVKILGSDDPEERVPLFTFSYKGIDGQKLSSRLASRGVIVSGGTLNATPAIKRFGLDSAARASCWAYSTPRDIDRLAEALRTLRR
jgi:cysteine desulfurase/selenocysteine lyase